MEGVDAHHVAIRPAIEDSPVIRDQPHPVGSRHVPVLRRQNAMLLLADVADTQNEEPAHALQPYVLSFIP
jgi:hypothetical protein